MPRQLSSATTLETLRKEAKRWLKALRAGDDHARERLRRAHPKAPPVPVLRDVQHALAVEYAFASWAALRAKVVQLEAQPGASPREAALQSLLRAADQGDAARARGLDAAADLLRDREGS